MKALALVILALLTVTFVLHLAPSTRENEMMVRFNEWKQLYGKNFGSNEAEAYRFAVYTSNYDWIQEQNSIQDETTYGENQFMDLTREEFKDTYLGFKAPANLMAAEEEETAEVRADVDWRTKGAVTPVKDQGQCGSCWAFSSTGSMEGLSKISGGSLLVLSESQLVDCSSSYGNQGCNGGLMDNAFKYVRVYGSCSESSYPYRPVTGRCEKPLPPTVFNIGGFKDVSRGSVSALKTATTQQPTSIAVDANNWSFYRGGVFSNCGSSLDHGVLSVGFTNLFWIVKNSWGANWGEKGYIRLKMGNTCGCANMASYPTAA